MSKVFITPDQFSKWSGVGGFCTSNKVFRQVSAWRSSVSDWQWAPCYCQVSCQREKDIPKPQIWPIYPCHPCKTTIRHLYSVGKCYFSLQQGIPLPKYRWKKLSKIDPDRPYLHFCNSKECGPIFLKYSRRKHSRFADWIIVHCHQCGTNDLSWSNSVR